MLQAKATGYFRDAVLANDMVQEAWFKIWQTVNKIRNPESFVPWMYRVLDNCCHDWGRKRGDEAVGLPDSFTGHPWQEGTYVDRDYEQEQLEKDQDRRLAEAVKKLKPRMYKVYYHRHVDGYKMKHIAEIMGIQVGTVKSQLSRAKKRLKKLLEEK